MYYILIAWCGYYYLCQIHILLVAITCPNETTSSIYWPTTIAGRTSTQPCFTTVPDGFKATRECDLFGQWSSPDVSDCKNGILRYIKSIKKYIVQIFVFSTLQPTLLCVSRSFLYYYSSTNSCAPPIRRCL